MDDLERPTEEPFGPDEPDFTDKVPQGAYVDEVPEEEPSEDLAEENGGEQADTDANM